MRELDQRIWFPHEIESFSNGSILIFELPESFPQGLKPTICWGICGMTEVVP
jgi:hypothetical protein